MTKIRKATLRDAGDVSRIVCLCYEGFGKTDGYPRNVIAELKEARGSEECIRKHITHEHMFVADDGGRIKGMVSVKDRELTKLYVDPHFKKRGIGKKLFIRAESFIKDCGHSDMFLGAAAQTPVRFYEKMGMHVVKTRKIDDGPCIGMTSTILEKTLLPNMNG